MKKNIFFFALIILNFQLFSQTWIQKSDLPSNGRLASFAFSIGSCGYVGGGQISISGIYTNDFWEYNEEGVWTQKANYAGGLVYSASTFTIANLGYVCCGYNGLCKNDVWAYNPQTNGWLPKNNFPGAARYGAFSFSIGDKGYLGMGSWGASNNFYNDFWEYNSINDSWTQKSSYNIVGRIHGVGFSINNKGYAGLGTDDGNGHYVNDFYEYNPANDTWTQKANYPSARGGVSNFVISNSAYVGLGQGNNNQFYNDFWEYNPSTNNWSSTTSIGTTNRSAGIGFTINNKGFIGLGISSGGVFLNDLWEFIPSTNSVSETNNFNELKIQFNSLNNQLILTSNISEKVNIQIFSINGTELINLKSNSNSSFETNLKKHGTYIYLIKNNKYSKTGKFVII